MSAPIYNSVNNRCNFSAHVQAEEIDTIGSLAARLISVANRNNAGNSCGKIVSDLSVVRLCLEKNNFLGAIARCDWILSSYNDIDRDIEWNIFRMRGIAHLEKREFSKAEEDFSRCLRIRKGDKNLRLLRGKALMDGGLVICSETGRVTGNAATDIYEAFPLNDAGEQRISEARCAILSGDLVNALELLGHEGELDNICLEVERRALLGKVYSKRAMAIRAVDDRCAELRKSIASYEKAISGVEIKKTEQRGYFYNCVGDCYLAMHQQERAMEQYENAREPYGHNLMMAVFAADNGDPAAQLLLGRLFYGGCPSVERDVYRARRYFQLAKINNLASDDQKGEAAVGLGSTFNDTQCDDLRCIGNDGHHALLYYIQAADLFNNDEAAFLLGTMYFRTSIEGFSAAHYLLKAANSLHITPEKRVKAALCLSELMIDGGIGYEARPTEAIHYLVAIEQEEAMPYFAQQAALKLAKLYRNGAAGVGVDLPRADYFQRRFAEMALVSLAKDIKKQQLPL
ncbi:MAG TPA: hypothetical protein VJK48_03620 [Chlamydiales bacterium]|nr:hypothetical protein [Chlamydiales bacterium]